MDNKKIGTGKAAATKHNDSHNLVEVMKPFVNFGVKSLAFLGTALVHIVKHIPKPNADKPDKGGKVIKI